MSFTPYNVDNTNNGGRSTNFVQFPQPTPNTDNKTIAWPFSNFYSPATDINTITRDGIEKEAKKSWVVDRELAHYLAKDVSISHEFRDASFGKEDALMNRYLRDAKQAAVPPSEDNCVEGGIGGPAFSKYHEHQHREAHERESTFKDGAIANPHTLQHYTDNELISNLRQQHDQYAAASRMLHNNVVDAQSSNTYVLESELLPHSRYADTGQASPGQPTFTESPFPQQTSTNFRHLSPGAQEGCDDQEVTTPQRWRASLFTDTATPDFTAALRSLQAGSLMNSFDGSAAELAGDSELIPNPIYHSDLQTQLSMPGMHNPLTSTQDTSSFLQQNYKPAGELANNSPSHVPQRRPQSTGSDRHKQPGNSSPIVHTGNGLGQLDSDPRFPQGFPHALVNSFHARPSWGPRPNSSPGASSVNVETPVHPSMLMHQPPSYPAVQPPWQQYQHSILQSPTSTNQHARQLRSQYQGIPDSDAAGIHGLSPRESLTQFHSRPQTPRKPPPIENATSSNNTSHASMSLQQFVHHPSSSPSRAASPDTPAQPIRRSPTAQGSGASSESGSVSQEMHTIPIRLTASVEATAFHQQAQLGLSPASVTQAYHPIAGSRNAATGPTVQTPVSPMAEDPHTPQSSIVCQGFINNMTRNNSSTSWEFDVVEQPGKASPATVEMRGNNGLRYNGAGMQPQQLVGRYMDAHSHKNTAARNNDGDEDAYPMHFEDTTTGREAAAPTTSLNTASTLDEAPPQEHETNEIKWYTPPEWALPLLSDVHKKGPTRTEVEEPSVHSTSAEDLDLPGALARIQQLTKENTLQKNQIQALQKGMATYQQQLSVAVKALEDCESTKQELQKLLTAHLKEAQVSQMQLQQLQMQLDERNSTIEQFTIANSSPRMSSICSKDFGSLGLGLHLDAPEGDSHLLADLLDGLMELQGRVMATNPNSSIDHSRSPWVQPQAPAGNEKMAEYVGRLVNMVRSHLATPRKRGYAASVGDYADDDISSSIALPTNTPSYLGEWHRSAPSLETAPPRSFHPSMPTPAPHEDSQASFMSSSHDTIQASPLAEALKRVRTGAINATTPPATAPNAYKPEQDAAGALRAYKARTEDGKIEAKWGQDGMKLQEGPSDAQPETSPLMPARPPPGPPTDQAFRQVGAGANKQHMDLYLEFIELRCALQQLAGLSDEVSQAVCVLLGVPEATLNGPLSSPAAGSNAALGDGRRACSGKEGESNMDDNLAEVKRTCNGATARLRACLTMLQNKQRDEHSLAATGEKLTLSPSSKSVSVQVPETPQALHEFERGYSTQHARGNDRDAFAEELQVKLEELEKELEDQKALSTRQSELTRELIEGKQKLQGELDGKVRRISELEMLISKQKRDLTQREKAADDLRSFCADLSHKLELRDAALQQLKETQAALEEQLKHKDELELQLQGSMEELTLQLKAQETSAHQLQEDLEGIQGRLGAKEDELHELQDELSDLQQQLQAQEDAARQLDDDKCGLKQLIAEKEELLLQLQAGNQQLSNELTGKAREAAAAQELQGVISELEAKLAYKEEELGQLNIEITETQRKLVEAQATHQAMSAELSASRDTAQQLEARVKQLEATCSKLATLQAEMADMAVELTNAKMRCSELQAQLTQVLAELSECRTQRDIAEDNAIRRQQELYTTQALCNKLQHQVTRDRDTLQEQQQQLQTLNSTLLKREDELSQATQQCQDFEAKLEVKGREVDRLMKALQELQAAAGSATDMAARSEDRLSELQQLLSDAENDVLRQKSRNMNLLVQIEGLERKLSTQQEETQHGKSHVAELEAQLEKSDRELDMVTVRCQELEHQLSSQQQQLSTWKLTHESSNHQLHSKDSILQQQEEELTRLRNEIAQSKELLNQLKQANAKVEELQQQIEEMQDSNVKLQEQVTTQKMVVEQMEASLSITHGQEDIIAELRHNVLSQDLLNKRLRNELEQQQEGQKQAKGQLGAELASLQKQVLELKQQLESRELAASRQESDLSAARAGLEELEQQLDNRDLAIAELQDDLHARHARCNELEAQLASRSSVIGKLERELNSALEKAAGVDSLEQSLQHRSEAFSQLESEMAGVHSMLQELKQQMQGRNLVIQQLEGELQAARQQQPMQEDLKQRLQNRDEVILQLETNLQAVQIENSSMEQQLQACKQTIQALNTEVEDARKQQPMVEELKQQLQSCAETIQYLEAQLQSVRQAQPSVEELEQQLQSCHQTIEQLEVQLQTAQRQQPMVEELKQQLHGRNQDIQQLEEKLQHLNELRSVAGRLEQELEIRDKVIRHLEGELTNARGHQSIAKQLSQQLEQQTGRMAQLQTEVKALQANASELGQQLDARNLLVSRMEAAAHTQATMVEELKGELHSKEDAISKLETQLISVQAQLALKPEQATIATQCTGTAETLVEGMAGELLDQQAELNQLKRELSGAADINSKMHAYVDSLQQENEDLHKQLQASEMAVSELHSLMTNLQSQMAAIEAAAQMQDAAQAKKAESHDTLPQQDQDVGNSRARMPSQTMSIKQGSLALPVQDLRNRFDSVATQTNATAATSSDKDSAKALHPSAATPEVCPMVPDQAADWILSLISGLETEEEESGVQKLKGRIESLEQTLLEVQQQRHGAASDSRLGASDSEQSSYACLHPSNDTMRQGLDNMQPGTRGISSQSSLMTASHASLQTGQSPAAQGESQSQGMSDKLMEAFAMEMWGAAGGKMDPLELGANEVWIQRAQKMYQAVVVLQEECKQHQEAARLLSAALEQERKSCRVLQQHNGTLQDNMKHQQKLQEVTQTVIGQLEENIRKVDSFKEVQDENAALRRGLHVITDYVRKLRTRTTTTVACSPIVKPGSGSSTPRQRSNPPSTTPSTAPSPRTSVEVDGRIITAVAPPQVVCTDSACQCELLQDPPPRMEDHEEEPQAFNMAHRESGVASAAGMHSPSHTDNVSSSEQDAGLWEQLQTAVTRSAVSCKVEIQQGNGGRQWLLATAIQMLRAQKNEIKRMVWTVKQLGPHGALVQGTSQLRQQYEVLLAKYAALQAAHQQLETTVQKLTEENTTLVNVIRDQQQMLLSSKSTPGASGRHSPLQPSLASSVRSSRQDASTTAPNHPTTSSEVLVQSSLALAMPNPAARTALALPTSSASSALAMLAASASHHANHVAESKSREKSDRSERGEKSERSERSRPSEKSSAPEPRAAPPVFQPYALDESVPSVSSAPAPTQQLNPWDSRMQAEAPGTLATNPTGHSSEPAYMPAILQSVLYASRNRNLPEPHTAFTHAASALNNAPSAAPNNMPMAPNTSHAAPNNMPSTASMTTGNWLVASSKRPSLAHIQAGGWAGAASAIDNQSTASTPDSSTGNLFSETAHPWSGPARHTTSTIYGQPSRIQSTSKTHHNLHHPAVSTSYSSATTKDQDLVQALINCYGSRPSGHGGQDMSMTTSDTRTFSYGGGQSSILSRDGGESSSVSNASGAKSRAGSRMRERESGGRLSGKGTASQKADSQRLSKSAKRDASSKVFKV